MSLGVNSKAAAVGVGVDNVVFQPAAQNVPRKILIIATYDPAKTLVVDEVPVQVTSPEDVGDQFGFGFMAHRLSEKAFAGGQGIETWIQPQAEPGGGVQATGDIDYAGASGVKAGTIYLYIAGDKVEVEIADADTADDLATKTVAAINADTTLPVTAVVNGVTTSQVDLTANTSGTYGNDISIAFNLAGESYPTGVVAPSITPMASGAGTPTISDALDGLGTGDDANEDFFTDVVHGYLQDTTTLDAIETYVGRQRGAYGIAGRGRCAQDRSRERNYRGSGQRIASFGNRRACDRQHGPDQSGSRRAALRRYPA
jgi:phage tail sheath gpL-like